MVRIFLLLLVCSVTSRASAQSALPPTEKYFLDSTFTMLPTSAGAAYRREIEYTDSLSGQIRDYFLSGRLQSRETYENLRKHTSNGPMDVWYKNGQLKMHQEYVHGQPNGELRLYYPDGHLKREEEYAAGKRLTGRCYAPSGSELAFFEYRIMPVYSKGDGSAYAIIADIGEHFVYPQDALRAAIQGRVFVSFDVTTKGKVVNVQVRKGLCPSVDAEAVRVVEGLASFTPGQQDGKIAKIRYTVPINLKLQ